MNFSQHLPPSAGQPRILALDDDAAARLPPETPAGRDPAAGPFDAIIGCAPPEGAAGWLNQLRPGGRLILMWPAPSGAEPDRQALPAAGYIHCLVETEPSGLSLYRGERPPAGTPVERIRALAAQPADAPWLHLLIQQTPNKPAWRLSADDRLTWRAATLLEPGTGRPALPAFSSLVKAVAFMQPAVLAGQLAGVNKIAPFPAEAAAAWPLPVVLNPVPAEWQAAAAGPWLEVDPAAAAPSAE